MSIASLAPDYIRAIMAYQPGKPISELAREMGIPEESIVKLASNENPLGMSARARDAAIAAIGEVSRYPDGGAFALKKALCERFGVKPEQLVIGNGSNDILELASQAFLAPGLSAVYSRHAFAVYPLATNARGARGIEVAAKNFGHDLDAMAAAIEPQTRVVFIANPNNPTGTFVPGAELEAFLAKVPRHVLVVLDEAYTEYLAPEQRYDSIAWLARFPNLLVSRTFSKAYGLAGLRVGYGIAHPEVADLMNRVRQPFNVSSVALAAAEAALGDDEFLARSAELNRRGMTQLVAAFRELGLEWIPSAGNFVTFKVGDAIGVNQALLRQGVIVRPIAAYGMPHWLRVSIGLPEENARFIEALRQALA
ncbi:MULTISPECIES: histidinol-phosphate transaminase [Thauera]|jgi:histidinol-phosphate aminotransferase|uniref:Histidinol-phosphate aminotransferase n=2 Tax=Thauera aminoaromatica TaxID=164330 RepID=C4KB60_THASP|nr:MULTISPECIES: histidinol-phosphate transaminase [Thauera]MDA0235187.1 histidinol-phosphate transaminase [Pseudomonadota bacterium]OPZ05640.1 MAG: Histidinol-phosphate aminotransferase 2 [Alphaproteobacteria bacterium ADurb.BinA305]ACR01636.1 histidinol-phosphate aminotransferase [Thauera aminoaromatica]ENO88450.1 histidinol-phosphate aminotransferase [Thauera aminoaromatica S2]KIN88534.1 histidinol-phosphate transaminase [Thauera sp. SWB20]